jgi:hypothetical protein
VHTAASKMIIMQKNYLQIKKEKKKERLVAIPNQRYLFFLDFTLYLLIEKSIWLPIALFKLNSF